MKPAHRGCKQFSTISSNQAGTINRKGEDKDGDTIHRRLFTAEEFFQLFEAARPDPFLFPLVVTAARTDGERIAEVTDMRLLTFSDAARWMNVSRQTIWRMVKEGRLPTVETRTDRYRVPAAALTAFVTSAA